MVCTANLKNCGTQNKKDTAS